MFKIRSLSSVQVTAQLRGDEKLPWEPNSRSAPAIWQGLRTLKEPVLQLLQRNSLLRPTVATFRDACDALLHDP